MTDPLAPTSAPLSYFDFPEKLPRPGSQITIPYPKKNRHYFGRDPRRFRAKAMIERKSLAHRVKIVALDDLWGRAADDLQNELGAASTEEQRIRALEAALLRMIIPAPATSPYISLLASTMRQGGHTVESLAGAAGVSRQHLTRLFRESTGVTPKLYLRLARFQQTLRHTAGACSIDWAQAAAHLGYADQSHLIAEFKQFSGITPEAFASRRWFHPFQDRAL